MANTKKTTTTTDKLAELGKGRKTVDDYLAERSQRLNGDKASTSSTTGGRGTSTPGKTTTTTDKLAELGKGRKTVNDYLEDYNRRQEKQFAQRNAAAQVNYYGATSAVHGLRNLYDSYSRQAAQENAASEQYKNGVMSMYSAVKNLADKAEAEKTVEKTTINPPRPMEHEGTMPIARGNQILGSVSADQVSLPELAGTPITNRGRSAAAVETDAMAKLAEETARVERIREYQGIPQRDDFDYERYQMGYIPPNGDQVLRAMSDEEKAVYRYIRINYGDKEAEEYYQYMKPIVESRRLEAASGELVKVGEEHPVAASVLSTMFSTTNALTGGAKLLYDAYKNVTDPSYTIDPYDQMNGAAFIRDKLREGTMTNMPEWGKFLYQTGMSIADSSTNALLFGGTGGAIALGTGAAADTAREVKLRGGTDEQALGMGVIAGAAELLTEKMGFGQLSKLIGGTKDNVLRAVLGHMTSEFGEEAGTEIANLFADWLIMQDKSQYDELVKEHGTAGAWLEMAKQVGLSGMGGALSGAVMGGGSAAIGKAFQQMQNRAVDKAPAQIAEQAAQNEGAVKAPADVSELALQTADNLIAEEKAAAQGGAQEATQRPAQLPRTETAGRTVETQTAKTQSADRPQVVPERNENQPARSAVTDALGDEQKQRFIETAEKYGDKALVFARNYEGGDVETYDKAFNALYTAGRVGLTLDRVGSVTDALTAGMSETAKKSIWQAGQNSVMTEVRPGAQKMYTVKATNLQKRQIAMLNEIGRKCGVEIDIVDSIRVGDSGTANGAYSGGRKIVVALDAAEGAIVQAGVHELTHYLKRTDADAYEVLKNVVMEHLQKSDTFILEDAISARRAQYAGQNMTDEDIIEEIVAEAVPTFLTDEKAVKAFVSENRPLAQKIRDFFVKFAEEIRQIAEKYMQRDGAERYEIENLLGRSDALTEIARTFDAALESAETRKDAQAGEAVYARKKPIRGADDVSKWTPAHQFMNEYMTSTERRLFEENLKNTPKSKWQRSKDGYFMVEAGRALVYTDFNRINPKIDRIVYFYTNDGTELSGAMGIWRKCEREGVGDEQNRRINDDYCGFGCVLVHYYDDWREIAGEEQRGKGTDGSGIGERSQKDGRGRAESEYSLTPTEPRRAESGEPVSGVTEAKFSLDSPAFRNWFGESKIVNEDGSPKVMYHGTDAYNEFTIFKKGKRGWLGPGIYLSASKSVAENYASKNGYDGRTYALYAKVDNPLVVTEGNPVPEILRAVSGGDRLYNSRSAKQTNDVHLITSADIKKLQAKGYDGIIWQFGNGPIEVSVFSPTQIKSATDNIGTYDPNNPDIRFSLSRPVERKGNLVAVHNLSADSLLKVIDTGAFLAPSTAVIRGDMQHSGFGDVTVAFDRSVVDPQADPRNRLYNRDAYTPVVGDEHSVYRVDAGAVKRLRDQIAPHMRFLPEQTRNSLKKYLNDISTGILSFENAEELIRDAASRREVMAAYLVAAAPKPYDLEADFASYEHFTPDRAQEKLNARIDDAINREDGFADWTREMLGGIFGGRYVEVGGEAVERTPDNIVRSMYEHAKEKGNSRNVGAHALSYALAREYDSISAARKDAGRLGYDEERYEKFGDADRDLRSWIDSVEQVNGKDGAYDVLHEAAYGGATNARDIRKAFRDKGWTIDRNAAREAAKIFEKISEISSPYFEAKPGYAVGFDKVRAVLIPDNVGAAALELIRGAFDNVIVYPAGNNEARLDVLNGLQGVKFSLNNTSSATSITDENQNLSLPVDVNVDGSGIRKLAMEAVEAGFDTGLNERMQARIRGIANKIMKETGSGYSKADFIENVTRLVEEYARSGWTEDTLRAVTEMAKKIIETSERADNSLREQYADVRKRLRESGVALTETQKQEAANLSGGYGEYRKSVFGTVNLKDEGMTLESLWDELSGQHPEIFTPGAVEGDQVRILQEFAYLMRPKYENPYGMDMDGAALEMAMRIEGDVMAMIGARDAAKSMYGSAEKLRSRFEAEYREKLKQRKAERVQKFQQIAADLKAAKAKGDSAEQAKIMSRYRAAMKETGLDEAYAEIRATLKAREEQKAENAKTREMREKVTRQASELMNMLDKPKKGRRIPTGLQDMVLGALEMLDINGAKADAAGRETVNAKAFRERLNSIRAFYEEVWQKQSAGEVPEGMDGLMMTFSERNLQIMKDALDVLSDGDKFRLRDMNGEQLASLNELMKNIRHTVDSIGKLWKIHRYQGVAELGDASIEEMGERGTQKINETSAAGKGRDFLALDMLEPVSYGERLGEGGGAIIQGLMDGEKEKFSKVREAAAATMKMMKDAGVSGYDIGKWKTNVQTVEFGNGAKVRMTDAMIMSLYLTAQRPQGRQHLLGNGLRIPTTKETGAQVRHVPLSDNDLQKIAEKLTDKQRKMADAMQAYLSMDVAKWGNDVTQRLYLYDAFTEDKYWPLTSDPNVLKTQEPEGDRAFSAILNAGFTKPLNELANNPVIITDAFDVFGRHIGEMASYAGYAEVMTDTMAWINYRQRTEDGLIGGTVKESIESLLGSGGVKYLTKLVQDINGARRGGDGTQLNKLLTNYKKAAVAGKIRVAIQQPTSIVRAATEINPIYLLRAMKPTWGSVKEMQKYSSLAWWKSNGNYEIGIGKSTDEMLWGDTSKWDTAERIGTRAIALGLDPGKLDDLAWSRIWEAAKLETKRRRKDLKVGSEEYFRAVTERFEAICDRTQVVDTVMHRSDIMRSKDGNARNLTAFMGEPIKSYNMLMRSIMEAGRNPKDAKAWRKLAGTGAAYVASVAATAAATALFDALKYRDDDDPIWEYLLNGGFAEDWAQQWLNAFKSNINPAGNIVLVKDIIAILDGEDVPTVAALEGVKSVSDALRTWTNFFGEDNSDKRTWYGLIKPTATAIANVTGLPLTGLMANAEMLAHAYDPKLLQTKSDMQTMDAAYDKLYQAMLDGNKKETLAIRTELNKGLYGTVPKNPAEIDTGIAKAMALTDERILRAWKLKREGRTNELTGLYKQIMADGFTDEQVKKAANSVESYMTTKYRALLEEGETAAAEELKTRAAKYGMTLEEKPEKDMEKELEAKTLNYKSLFAAIRGGDTDDIADAVEILISESDAKTEEGKEQAVRDQVSEEFREEYVGMVRGGKAREAEKLAGALEIVGFDEEDRTEWLKDSYREDLKRAVTDGDMDEAEKLLDDMREEYGMSDSAIATTIRNKYQQEYIDLVVAGREDEADELAEKMMALGLKGRDGNYFRQSNLDKWVRDWEKKQEEDE